MKVLKPAFLFAFLFFSHKIAFSQITVNNNAPYNTATYLIDSLLLGDGVIASNHSFQGDSAQIGFFNGVNSNIGLDSGIVMSTGRIDELVPGVFGEFVNNNVEEPNLLGLANSVPPLIGQNFTVTSVNDIAILEFDFVPVSSYMSFKYVFASREYFAFENSQFNDVFGFFISGPNIAGPYFSPPEFPNGSINIATFQSIEANSLGVDLPITVSSVNGDYNSAFFVSNQNNDANTVNSTVDGFTVEMTAEAVVVCGQTYRIRLAIADGGDTGLSSFVLLDAGSFSSPPILIGNSLGVNSDQIFTDCGASVTLSAQVQHPEFFEFLWNTGDTTQSITVPPGYYWVQATDSSGCSIQSDSMRVYSQPIPEIELSQENHFCENSSVLLIPEVSGGTLPYEYNWINYSNDLQLEVNQEGTYTIVATDSNNCTDTASIEIVEMPLPELSYSPQDILVCGGTPVLVSVDGAESYNWSPNLSLSSDTGKTIEINVLSAITYTVEGTDSNGCINSLLVPVSATENFDLDITANPVSCQGFSDGSITILAGNSAVSPLQYSIDGGQNFHNNFTFNNLDFGTYDVQVMDGLGCIISETAVVGSSQPEIELLIASSNPKCYDDTSGVVWVEEISGGNVASTYSYKWYNSLTNELVGTDSLLNVPAAAYYLVVEDDNGCRITDEVDVEQPMALLYDTTKTDISCFGEKDGEISINIYGGGTPPYNYDWLNYGNASTSFLENLEQGTYDLLITDSNNCMTSLSFQIEEPLLPLSFILDSTKIECHGESTGSASVSVNGGSPPYFYQWSSGHVTPTAEQLSSGIYTITVTDSRGCTAIDSIEVVENNAIVTNKNVTPTSCYGTQDGTAVVTASGGVGNLTYNWSNGISVNSITSGLGEYILFVEDELGCIKTDTILINQPRKISVRLMTTDVSCNGGFDGKLESYVGGGTLINNQTYTYNWTIDGNPLPYNNNIAYNLPASTSPYALEVVDANGCSQTVYSFISEPSKLVIDTSEIIASYCYNIPSGKALVIASGGFLVPDGEYVFSWSTGDTGSVLHNQIPGTYTVTVEDDNSCQDSLVLEIPLDDKFQLTITSDSLNCYDDASGKATVVSTGGFSPYTYSWNTPNLGIVSNVSNANSNTLMNITQGVTSVAVTDVNGCTKMTQVNVEQPEELVFSVFKEFDESCSGEVSACDGVLRVQAEGGIGSYNFKCLDASNDVISSSQSNFEALFTSLCADFYQIVVEDENNCVASASGNGLILPVEIIAGSPVESAINTNPGSITNSINCYGDTAVSASVLNPNPSYTYDWYVDNEVFSSGLSAVLPAGEIHLRATATPNCYTNSESITINQPSQLMITQEIDHVSCNGGNNGNINIEGVGGVLPYTYSWSHLNDGLGNTEDINNLAAGVYTLLLKDASNCERQFEIEVFEPSSLSASSIVQDVSCNGGNDGSATLTVTGGTAPYSVNWQGEDSTSLNVGVYDVVISDANSCSSVVEITVDQPSAVTANFNSDQTPFVASASGGNSPYTFDWLYFGNYQSSGNTFSPSESGEITLVAKDASGCESRIMKIITNVEVSELEKSKLLIYPNPARTHFIVEVNSENQNQEFVLNLIDSRGRIVKEKVFKESIKIDRDDLADGLYFLQISSETESHKQSIVLD